MAPLGCGVRRKRPAKFCCRCDWIGIELINQSAKLNRILITFEVEMLLWFNEFNYLSLLRLVESDVSFAWVRPLRMHLLLVLLNKLILLKSACIYHYSFACCFSRYFKRCDVIVTQYFMKIKCFSFLNATKTSVLQRFNLLHVVVLQRRSQKLFA